MRKPKYFGFTDRNDVAVQFEEGTGNKWDSEHPFVIAKDFPKDGNIIFAAYGQEEAYSGSALVVYRKAGKLYEVNGSHCSCMGLEGQWEPEETTVEALAMRRISDYAYDRETVARFYTLFPGKQERS